jgi:hypothetical protein
MTKMGMRDPRLHHLATLFKIRRMRLLPDEQTQEQCVLMRTTQTFKFHFQLPTYPKWILISF